MHVTLQLHVNKQTRTRAQQRNQVNPTWSVCVQHPAGGALVRRHLSGLSWHNDASNHAVKPLDVLFCVVPQWSYTSKSPPAFCSTDPTVVMFCAEVVQQVDDVAAPGKWVKEAKQSLFFSSSSSLLQTKKWAALFSGPIWPNIQQVNHCAAKTH